MFDDPLTNFERKIQSRVSRKTLLELFDNPQRMQIVIEICSVQLHQLIQFSLPGMAKRRMANVVDQGQRFRQIGIQAERASNSSGNLSDFKRVGQPIAEMV